MQKSRVDEHLHAESTGGVNGIALACYRAMRRSSDPAID
jgi:hypothetical protein